MKKIQFNGNKNIVSEAVRANRVVNRLTQNDVAIKMQAMGINIDQQMISKIESNDRFVTDYELICLCKILKIDYVKLFNDFLL